MMGEATHCNLWWYPCERTKEDGFRFAQPILRAAPAIWIVSAQNPIIHANEGHRVENKTISREHSILAVADLPATPRQRRVVLILAVVQLVAFVVVAPLAEIPLKPLPACASGHPRGAGRDVTICVNVWHPWPRVQSVSQ